MLGPIVRDRRAISKEGMAALAFALTVAMMGVTGGILLQSSGQLSDGGPVISAEAEPITATDGPDGQWIRLEHESGVNLDVTNLTVNVSLPEHRKRAGLHGLPTDSLRQSDYDGNHVFTVGPRGVEGAAVDSGTDRVWSSGEIIAVQITPRRVDLQPGQTVRVTVYYQPTGELLFDRRLEVVDR